VYRHVNTPEELGGATGKDKDSGLLTLGGAGGPNLTFDSQERASERIADWSNRWISDAPSGPLGGDRKSKLKAAILQTVLDQKRHGKAIAHIEKMNKGL
jgi:hypothetical protein